MSDKPIPARPRQAADVIPFGRYKPLTAEAEALARQSAGIPTAPLADINHNISNNEAIFTALAAFLVAQAQKGRITTYGATIVDQDKTLISPFREREGELTLCGVNYTLTLYSARRQSAEGEADTFMANRLADENIGLFERDGDEKPFHIYADRVNGVPQINDPACWWVGYTDAFDIVKESTFEDFLANHHPDRYAAFLASITPAEDTGARGFSVGTHRARRDGRHLAVVEPTTEVPEPAAMFMNHTRANAEAPARARANMHRRPLGQPARRDPQHDMLADDEEASLR